MPLFVKVLARILIFCVIFNVSANIAAETPSDSTDNKENPQKPNIIFILADDLGFNDVPWHNKGVMAPNLQRLAQEGIILEQSYVQPICSPTRAALMSGTYPFATGRQSDVIWPLMPTGLTLNATIIPQFLKPLGYATHAVGKWHLGFCNWKYTPTERGFDSYKGYYTGSEDYYSHIRHYHSLNLGCKEENVDKNGLKKNYTGSEDLDKGSSKEYYTGSEDLYYSELLKKYPSLNFECGKQDMDEVMNTKNRTEIFEEWKATSESTLDIPDGFDFRSNKTPDFDAYGTYSTYEYASHIEDIFNSSDPDVPQFIYMAFQSVHSPLQVPENYTKPYMHIKNHNRRTYLGMVTALDEAVGRIVAALKNSGMVTALDEAVGRIVAALKNSGRYNNSVIIFSTDNGGPTISGGNNWPLRGNKTTLWEGGTRGAAFVHSPLLPNPGSVSNNLIHVTDWLATLVAIAGGTPPNSTDSVNQWNALKGTAKHPPRKEIVYTIDDKYGRLIKSGLRAGIRYGNYKLLVGNPGPGDWTPPPETTKKDSQENMSDFFEELFSKSNTWNFYDHTNLVKTMKEKCKDMKCMRTILRKYKSQKKSKTSNNPELWDKFMEKVKQHANKFRKWMQQVGGGSKKKSLRKSKNRSWTKISNKKSSRKTKDRSWRKFSIPLKEELVQTNLTINDFGSVDQLLQSPLTLRLYNLKDDPEERKNLAASHRSVVITLLTRLMAHSDRYVPPDTPKDDPRGQSKFWGGVWSPGWC